MSCVESALRRVCEVARTSATLYEVGPGQAVEGYELCGNCMGLSPGISMDGETLTHCPLCHDGTS